MDDIGESMVSAYMREVRKCDVVVLNTRLPNQGEIDVVGIKFGQTTQVWLAEVAIHLATLDTTYAARIQRKILAAQHYGTQVFPTANTTIEFWSPRVRPGLMPSLQATGASLVVDSDFRDRVAELLATAAGTTRTTSDPAFRLLQILSHLRQGAQPERGGNLTLW